MHFTLILSIFGDYLYVEQFPKPSVVFTIWRTYKHKELFADVYLIKSFLVFQMKNNC